MGGMGGWGEGGKEELFSLSPCPVEKKREKRATNSCDIRAHTADLALLPEREWRYSV
jgi:hypothetical protein